MRKREREGEGAESDKQLRQVSYNRVRNHILYTFKQNLEYTNTFFTLVAETKKQV